MAAAEGLRFTGAAAMRDISHTGVTTKTVNVLVFPEFSNLTPDISAFFQQTVGGLILNKESDQKRASDSKQGSTQRKKNLRYRNRLCICGVNPKSDTAA